MTIQELIKEYEFNNDKFDIELIQLYAKYAICEYCPLVRQCAAIFEDPQECVNYLMSVMEL